MEQLNPPSQHEIQIQEARKVATKPTYEQLEQKLNILTKKNKNRRMSLNQLGQAHCETLRLLDIANDERSQYFQYWTSAEADLQKALAQNESTNKPWWKLW